ncbi:MAG: phage tail protein, partial [Sphingomonadaceae bacterium]|nr:phage tail protein [Sphingomonadaceae bacterium]
VPSTADSTNPRNDAFAVANANVYSDTGAPSGNFMHADTVLVQNTGGNQAQNNMQPYQVIRYCIATVGIFPPRN